jgi:uncharacterized damage-inducible protein DinB
MKLSQFFSHWDQVHNDTLAVIGQFRETELDYISFEGSWTVKQIALHIAHAEEGWFRCIVEKVHEEWPPSFEAIDFPNGQSITTLLANTHKKTMAYLGTHTLDDLERVIESRWGDFSLQFVIWHVIEHEIHHRGELSLVLGILGRGGLDV